MKSPINRSIVFRTAVQMCDNIGIGRRKETSKYHIIYGYARLLNMDESMLHAMFEEKEYHDLEGARLFFKEKNIDSNLVRQGLPYLIPFIEGNEAIDDGMLIEGEGESPSTYDILCAVVDGKDPILDAFHSGKQMEDVFSLQEDLKKRKKEEEEDKRQRAEEMAETVRPEDAKISEESHQLDGKTGMSTDRQEKRTGGQFKESEEEENTSAQEMVPENAEKTGEVKFFELSEKYRRLRVNLLEVVKGQREPVEEFVQGCYQGEVLENGNIRREPRAVFLFVGPPGVGKTLLAQTAAEELGYPTMTFNMSEYSASQSHEGLIGIAPFYGNAQEGRLVEFVRENPHCVLIFDEIEKAHRNTIQVFLQILDRGTADNVYKKKKTDFTKAIIIFTSNACRSIYENQTSNIAKTPKAVIIDALRNEIDKQTGEKVFPDAICSRIAAGNVIMFNHLSSMDMMQMVNDNFDRSAKQIQSGYGFNVAIDPKLSALFMFHQGGQMDARIAFGQSDNFIKNELYELARQVESHPDLLNGINTLKFELSGDEQEMSEQIYNLFVNRHTIEIAVLCRKEDKDCFVLPDKYKVHFADNAEDLKKLLDQDLALILLDLRAGLVDDGKHGVSLDDYDSDGINSFRMLEQEGMEVPVQLFVSGENLSDTDVNTFLRRGAGGVISSVGLSKDSVQRQVMQTVDAIFMDRQAREFARQGKVLTFNTEQVRDGDTLVIRYHKLMKKQALDIDSSSVLLSDMERPAEKFDDVIGAENAKDELRYFIKYLSNPRKFINEGGKPAKGLLLYGPPGTGKTMLARAMAGETDFAFIQTSATEFLNKWYGQSEQNVRDLFRRAKKFAPSIIFIDEIDAIGKSRTGEDRHTESVLNALLTEMDGFTTDNKKPIFVIAATNYQIDGKNSRMALDPALVRRFDNKIYVDLPNAKERRQYLSNAVRKKGFTQIDAQTISNLSDRTPGVSIAILQNVIDLAFRNARKEGRIPSGKDLLTALEEYNYGEKREWAEDYYRTVAIHESGHAYIAWLSGEKPSYITIESRSDFGGYMEHESKEDKPNYSKEELIWRIRCALAGRAAEEVFFGKEASLNTGASADFAAATRYACTMICEYAMMEDQYVALPFEKVLQTNLAGMYLQTANHLIGEEMKKTIELLRNGKEKVQKLADRLLADNNLTGDKILEVLEE